METNVDFLVILISAGLVQGVLLALALLTLKRGNPTANRVFGVFLLAVSIDIGYGILFYSRYILVFPHLLQLNTPVPFLYGPLLFFYFKALVDPTYRVRWRDALHGIPFALCLAYFVPLYVRSGAYKLDALIDLFLGLPPESYVIGSLKRLHYLAYLVLMVRMLKHYAHRLKAQTIPATQAQRRKQRLMRWLVGVFLFLWLTDIYDFAFAFELATTMDVIQVAVIAGFLVVATYLALRQPHLFSSEPTAPPRKKYATSSLKPEDVQAYAEKLRIAMKTEKLHRDGNLTLPRLARTVSLSPHLLSQLLNEHVGENFAQFVNRHRIEEAKAQLVDPALQHFTIAAIAEEVGFNSTSAFNAAFKKITGATPSQYRQQALALSTRSASEEDQR